MRRSLLRPLLVLMLFAALVPVPIAYQDAGASSESCLMLTSASPASDPLPVTALEQCSAALPRDVELLDALGAAYEDADPARAEAVYLRVLRSDPAHADVRLRLGRLLLRRGAPTQAIAHAETALRTQPNRRMLLDLIREARASDPNRADE